MSFDMCRECRGVRGEEGMAVGLSADRPVSWASASHWTPSRLVRECYRYAGSASLMLKR